jgi:hypothetical protein
MAPFWFQVQTWDRFLSEHFAIPFERRWFAALSVSSALFGFLGQCVWLHLGALQHGYSCRSERSGQLLRAVSLLALRSRAQRATSGQYFGRLLPVLPWPGYADDRRLPWRRMCDQPSPFGYVVAERWSARCDGRSLPPALSSTDRDGSR